MSALEAAFEDHRRLLWRLGYRMLGTPQDADEVVQDTFLRALRRPPADDRPLRPWLVRVTVNLARDRLRRRRNAPYPGPWLPAPIEADASPTADEQLARLERLSYGLMVALEQLTPTQRAVWLLREVMGLSTEEAAEALDLRPGSVKVALHRARRALGPAPDDPPETAMAAVAELADAILRGDVERVAALLTDDVVALADGGGVFHAARVPVRGPRAVARLLVGIARKVPDATYTPAWLGDPAVWVDVPPKRGFAPRSVTLFTVRGGRIAGVWNVLAPAKVHGASAPGAAAPAPSPDGRSPGAPGPEVLRSPGRLP